MSDRVTSAVRAVTRLLASEDGRKILTLNKYHSGTTIVPAHEGELIGDVLARARSHDLPVLLVVYFPERTERREFTFLQMTPGTNRSQKRRVVTSSTIGLLADSLDAGEHASVDFRSPARVDEHAEFAAYV